MRTLALTICAVLLGTTAAFAECAAPHEAALRQVDTDAKAVEKTLRRLKSRVDGQNFRISNLPASHDRTGLPDAPALPHLSMPAAENGEGCTTAPARQQAAVATFQTELTQAQNDIELRDKLLSEIEESGKIVSTDLIPQATAPVAPEDQPAAEPPQPEPQPPEPVAEAPAPVEPAPTPEPETAAETAPAESTTAAVQPMTDPANPEAFIRVLSLPGMQRHDAAGDAGEGAAIPVFSVLYVFDRKDAGGEEWLHVGRIIGNGPEGWVKAGAGVDWTNMLVMQFAPRGKRHQVLFFKDESALTSLVSGPFYQRDAQKLYDGLADEREKATREKGYTPAWDAALTAIEPESAVTFDAKPYLLPILDWKSEMFDGTTDTTLIRVAAVPSAPSASIGARDEQSFANSARRTAMNGEEFRVGVVFAIDTTISMRPFIERTYQAVESFYNAFSQYDSASYVSFGLVGFRDNISPDPEGIEYVSKVFQPLDPEAPAKTVLSNMHRMEEATVSTRGFAEDAFAGVVDAIDQNDWEPYDARIVILVTDASARTGEGAADPAMTVERLREKARAQNITIIPVHLQTPANADGDADTGRSQYTDLSRTGDLASDKYIPVDATSQTEFAEALDRLSTRIARDVMGANAGDLVNEDLEPVPATATAADKLADVVGNEIFRAQLESLGRIDDGAAPSFLSGWAADKDLLSPEIDTLEVSAFLTRNQLSTLDKRLEAIVNAFRSGGDSPQAFFANLQMLAAQTATDPDSIKSGDRSTIEAILPGFLKNLPYRSQVLRLDQAYWSSMSVSQQQEFIENLEAKRRTYADIFGQTNLWADFGANDPGLEATPVRLSTLP